MSIYFQYKYCKGVRWCKWRDEFHKTKNVIRLWVPYYPPLGNLITSFQLRQTFVGRALFLSHVKLRCLKAWKGQPGVLLKFSSLRIWKHSLNLTVYIARNYQTTWYRWTRFIGKKWFFLLNSPLSIALVCRGAERNKHW